MAIPYEPDDIHKAQAKRLREFLQLGGVMIKHMHALEAIARIHGEQNWHLLSYQAARHRRTVWLISTYGENGLSRSTLAEDRVTAMSVFLHNVYAMCCQPFTGSVHVLGQDEDGEQHGLYFFVNGRLSVSLTRPTWTEHELDSPSLPRYQFELFADIARDIQAAVDARPDGGATRPEAVISMPPPLSLWEAFLARKISDPRGPMKVRHVVDSETLWGTMAKIQIRVVTPAPET